MPNISGYGSNNNYGNYKFGGAAPTSQQGAMPGSAQGTEGAAQASQTPQKNTVTYIPQAKAYPKDYTGHDKVTGGSGASGACSAGSGSGVGGDDNKPSQERIDEYHTKADALMAKDDALVEKIKKCIDNLPNNGWTWRVQGNKNAITGPDDERAKWRKYMESGDDNSTGPVEQYTELFKLLDELEAIRAERAKLREDYQDVYRYLYPDSW